MFYQPRQIWVHRRYSRYVAANSSSAFSEHWAIALHGTPGQMATNPNSSMAVQYADPTDLMLMMDMRLGGGVVDAVNEGQKLIRPKAPEG